MNFGYTGTAFGGIPDKIGEPLNAQTRCRSPWLRVPPLFTLVLVKKLIKKMSFLRKSRFFSRRFEIDLDFFWHILNIWYILKQKRTLLLRSYRVYLLWYIKTYRKIHTNPENIKLTILIPDGCTY